jgi:hypothetical protein
MFRVLALLVGLFLVASCKDNERVVKKEDYGDDWPFTVQIGTIKCLEGIAPVLSAGGHNYALNGHAMARGYRDLHLIWLPDPDTPGLKKNISPFVDIGNALCDNS